MLKLCAYSLAALLLTNACQTPRPESDEPAETTPTVSTSEIVDSLLYYRHHHRTTDILSRNYPNLLRAQAIELQLAMLEKELESGAKLVGWKMGGTITDDSSAYDPMFGYILDRNLIAEDSAVLAENFPGGQVMVEGEVGVVLKQDFPEGANSLEALIEGIDYVVSAVEFAQATAVAQPNDTSPLPIDYVFASGMGQAGTMIGSGKMTVDQFDAQAETVACYVNEEKVAEGSAARVYQSPLHAVYSLANMLPEYDQYLRKGDVVITGSLYDNPTIDSTSQVRLEYAHLGTITFSMK